MRHDFATRGPGPESIAGPRGIYASDHNVEVGGGCLRHEVLGHSFPVQAPEQIQPAWASSIEYFTIAALWLIRVYEVQAHRAIPTPLCEKGSSGGSANRGIWGVFRVALGNRSLVSWWKVKRRP